MKKLILITFLIFATNSVQCQEIKKDSFISVHTLTDITLKSGVTMDDFKAFYLNKVIPAYEENIPEVKFYLIEAVRGEEEGRIGVLWIAETYEVRDKYHKPDDSYTEIGKAAREKIKPVLDQLNKMATFSEKFTDWVVQ